MNLDEIKVSLEKDIEKLGYHLYSLNYFKKDKILEVLLDESLDLDTISDVSSKISDLMDKYDEDFDEYLLDVSCAGAEKAIRNDEEIVKAVDSYIHVSTNNITIEGTLKSFVDDCLTIEYKDKTRVKTLEVNKKDIKEIRYAVKF